MQFLHQKQTDSSAAGREVLLLLTALLLTTLFAGPAEARRKTQEARTAKTAMTAEPLLKVKLGSLQKKLAVKFPDGGQIVNQRGRRIKSLRRNETFTWSLPEAGRKKRRIEHNGETLQLHGAGSMLELNGKKYRGDLHISISDKGALAVNYVGIENYLRGVVGSEIGSRSPAESIKAQTVIARTYAYASRGKHAADGADVCDSTHCQVYSGVSAERDTIDPAVAGTRGIIMISDGEPIATLYHATCGGMTSDNDKVFGGVPRSYLRRVVCPFCREGTNYRWSRSIGLNELRTALREERIVFERLIDAEIESPGRMDRVTNLILSTNRGVFKIKGTTIRRLFNLPSTTFVLVDKKLQQNAIASRPTTHDGGRPTGRVRATVTALETNSPRPMFIMSALGLKRATRPAEGWKVIAAATETEPYLAAPAAVAARSVPLSKLELFGRGYGHQVGLCQSGAVELGRRDWSYRQILALYYSNVALRSLDY